MDKGLLLKQVRECLELNQTEMSRVLGITRCEVNKLERNVRILPDSRVFELMYFFELETDNNEITMVLFAPYIKDIVRRRNEGKTRSITKI